MGAAQGHVEVARTPMGGDHEDLTPHRREHTSTALGGHPSYLRLSTGGRSKTPRGSANLEGGR